MNTRIRQKITEIEQSVELIESHIPSSLDEFENSGLLKDGIYKRLEFVIQNILDIITQFHKEGNSDVPGSYDDIIYHLHKKKIFSPSIIVLLKEMKGLRNILVHRYGTINDEIIYTVITTKLDDIYKVLTAITKHLET